MKYKLLGKDEYYPYYYLTSKRTKKWIIGIEKEVSIPESLLKKYIKTQKAFIRMQKSLERRYYNA